LGLALAADLRGVQIALDIDDWEVGLSLPHDASQRGALRAASSAVYGAVRRGQPNSVLGTWLCQRLVRRVPMRLVSNRWLERRYGGTLLYHVRDDRELDPERVRVDALRARLRLEGRSWVGFVGTVRVHKGVTDLIGALSRLRGDDAPGLLLLGANPVDPVVRETLRSAREALGGNRVRNSGLFSLSDLPEHVAVADVVAVPSRETPASRGQLPAKLFDAMTMARPIVATGVNDVPEVLGGCGIVVPPADPAALASALARFRDPAARRAYGCAARQRVLERFSFRAGRRLVAEFVERVAS
jgi:glycosyltransferase involved in cell wall biosynthesis